MTLVRPILLHIIGIWYAPAQAPLTQRAETNHTTHASLRALSTVLVHRVKFCVPLPCVLKVDTTLDPSDKESTGCTTGRGIWQFSVLPLGLCNALTTSEHLMEQFQVLADILYLEVILFLVVPLQISVQSAYSIQQLGVARLWLQ